MFGAPIWASVGRQRRQFLPASRIGSPSLNRPVSKWCGGDALRLQSADPMGLSVMKLSLGGGYPPLPPRHDPSDTAAPASSFDPFASSGVEKQKENRSA